MVEWIELAKKKPRDKIACLVSDGQIVVVAVPIKSKRGEIYWWDQHGVTGYDREWDFKIEAATHWAKLPKPPKKRRVK